MFAMKKIVARHTALLVMLTVSTLLFVGIPTTANSNDKDFCFVEIPCGPCLDDFAYGCFWSGGVCFKYMLSPQCRIQ